MVDQAKQLSPNKQALLKIRELKQQLQQALNDAQHCTGEAIAIVSMACRFPRSSNTPEKFWQSLMDQADLVSEIPEERWDLDAFHDEDPEVPGKMYARHGVFLEDLDQMDPEFFGISPREATWVDPQQRLLMEVGWEAIERAGWLPEKIGADTGVFVGWMHNDYQNEASDSFLNLNPYIATGAAGSFLCGRLAYYLGLQGPSVAVDTACSSSLVALHLAIQSLQQRDCDQALVGGVNAICSPTTNILTCKLKALSPQGHSRAFDAAADGYLRGEGCGVVTLKRLADAQRDGDPVLGIVRGSAVGHNGFSSGLTAPNPKAQEKVIRQALQRANISPEQVAYLEAHGTGTELGDPIEINAAAAAYCQHRSEQNPLLVGSVKTNIGHLEAAAGMAGLIKVLLAIQNESIPGQLNFEEPNPHIPWQEIPVKVLTESTDWPDSERRIAGVSAFGMSGTNAHVVVEAPNRPTENRESNSSSSPTIITLSARNEDALFELAHQYAEALQQDESISVADVGWTSNTARSHFEYRSAAVARDRTTAIAALKALARGSDNANTAQGHSKRSPRIAWQFTGQGSQFPGMGRGLYDSQPVFKSAIDECDQQLQKLRDGSLLDILFNDNSDPALINDTHWTQPAIFALQMGLAKLLQSWNMQPDAVLGHSVGQYAAACVAGIMSWQDGLQLIAQRGRLIGELPAGGQMLAVFAAEDVVREAIESDPQLSLAALNGTHIVISGSESSVENIARQLATRSIKTKALTTSHAFHSHLMDPVLEPFANIADQVSFAEAQIPLICNVSGETLPADALLDGQYWSQHIRAAVRFAPGIEAVKQLNCDLIMELGPQAILTRMAAANWDRQSTLFSFLNKDVEDQDSVFTALANSYAHGVTPDFHSIHAEQQHRRVDLPTYPFQRRRFWGPDKPRAFHAEYHTAHPLLGSKISLAGAENETRYENFIDQDSPAWMPDHEVMNSIVLPGAALVEMAIEAAAGRTIQNAVFEQPLRPQGRTALQTVIKQTTEGDVTLQTFAANNNTQNWLRHFSCQFSDASSETIENVDRAALESQLTETESPQIFYQKMNSLGLNYGPAFQAIQSIRFSEQQVLTHLQPSGDIRGYTIPPTMLDAALHSLAIGILKAEDDNLFLPVGIGQVTCHQPITDDVWCHAIWKQTTGSTRTADLFLFDDQGQVLLQILDLKVQQVSLASLRQLSGAGAERLVFELDWQTDRLTPAKLDAKNWLMIGNSLEKTDETRADFRTLLANQLRESDHRVIEVSLSDEHQGSDYTDHDDCSFSLNGRNREGWLKLFRQIAGERSDFELHGVIWLTDTADAANQPAHQVECLLNFVQSLIEFGWRRLPCGLELVTQNAISTSEHDEIVKPAQTQFWGMGRVVGAEQPELRCRMLDITGNESLLDDTVQMAADVILTDTLDNQHAIRNGQLFVPRMSRSNLKRTSSFALSGAGCYLITGGLGMLGREAAAWLCERGATHLVLVSRRAPDDSAETWIKSLADQGCTVTLHSADTSQTDDMAQLFARFGNDLPQLSGLIHSAGVLDDGLIESQDWERFEKVLKPKIDAAALLDELTRDLELEFFILYSSAASVLGSPGQSNYATGNAFLDGLAYRRRQQGLPALAINWGPWSVGMADDERILKRLSLQGITPLEIAEAHSALELMLSSETVQATVLDVDWRRMRIGPTGNVPPLLQKLVGSKRANRGADSAFVGKLKTLQASAQRELLLKTIQDSLQRILSTPGAPETDRPLIEMGLDSLMAVEFGTELQQMLGDQFNVGPTMLFDHPTIDAITDHVLELVATAGQSDSDSTSKPQSTQSNTTEAGSSVERDDIAIIGMSCRFPGAQNVDQFWQNLLDGVDSVCDIPNDRWDIDRFYSADREPGKMYTRRGGFLDDIADFDAEFFNISDQEACWIDPQHRMLLENSYRAMEDAGIATAPLLESNVGVFMGIMGSDYAFLPTLDDEDVIKGFQGAGLSHSAGVGRISYLFGFEGPSVAVDTASSSSLVAVFQAMRSLQDGNCNLALAGGVNAILAPVNSLLMSKSGLLSPDGRCKSFSKSADGFGRGEGCGVVILKRLKDAERDGDRVMAVIRGGAVVHNGFSGGITSPSGKAQARVIDAALKDAGIAPSQVQYLEAHGTGTEFGDPMELGAAMKIYGKGRKQDEPLLVGSVKANISHLEAAGGSSGLIKTVLAIQHGLIPQQIHLDEPTPHIPWQRMPVQMISENREWPGCETRTAGITALGLVGTNAHLILSEHASTATKSATETATNTGGNNGAAVNKASVNGADKNGADNNGVASKGELAAQTSTETQSHLLVLSARNETALLELKRSYAKFLSGNPQVELDRICRTAASGRRHFDQRVALSFESRDQAIKLLQDQHGSGDRQQTPTLTWLFPDDSSDCRSELRDLLDSQPIVAEFLAQADQRFRQHLESTEDTLQSIFDLINDQSQTTPRPQTLAYLLQASLVQLWSHWGIEADSAFGFGIGQYSAAAVAGCLCFKDALVLVYERERRLNDPAANDPATNDDSWEQFEQLADMMNFYPPNLPLVCSISGQIVSVGQSLSGSYWREHAQAPYKLESSSESLDSLGHSILLNLGQVDTDQALAAVSDRTSQRILHSVDQRLLSVEASILSTLGKLYESGCNPDFVAVFERVKQPPVSLPNYPFQKKRYWITEISQFMDQLEEDGTSKKEKVRS